MGFITKFQLLVIAMYLGSPIINVLASNVPILDFNCIPCVTFGMYYCYDDPWVVQFNGDKCYQYYVDRVECEATQFSNAVENCTTNTSFSLKESAQCNIVNETFQKYRLPIENFEIELEPRSSCSFSVNAFSAELHVLHQYPIINMHSDNGTVVDLHNTSFRVGNEFGQEGDCFNSPCNTTYQVELQEQFFYFANWDTN